MVLALALVVGLVLEPAATGLVVACAYLLTAPLGVLTASARERVFGAQSVAPPRRRMQSVFLPATGDPDELQPTNVEAHEHRPLGPGDLGHRPDPHRGRPRRRRARRALAAAGLDPRPRRRPPRAERHRARRGAGRGPARGAGRDVRVRRAARRATSRSSPAPSRPTCSTACSPPPPSSPRPSRRWTSEAWTGTFSRTPGADPIPVAAVPSDAAARDRDPPCRPRGGLRAGRTGRDDFVVELLDVVCVDQATPARSRRTPRTSTARGRSAARAARPSRGTGADLGWWLTGRGEGGGLSSDAGALPRLGPWRRASATAGPTPER